MITRLFPKRKKKIFANLMLDIPVHHYFYMKYNKRKVGSCIPHKDVEELMGRTKGLKTNILYGRTAQFLFIARGDEMINHIMKHGSVPILRHPTILVHIPLNSEHLLKKRVSYFKRHDQQLLNF